MEEDVLELYVAMEDTAEVELLKTQEDGAHDVARIGVTKAAATLCHQPCEAFRRPLAIVLCGGTHGLPIRRMRALDGDEAPNR